MLNESWRRFPLWLLLAARQGYTADYPALPQVPKVFGTGQPWWRSRRTLELPGVHDIKITGTSYRRARRQLPRHLTRPVITTIIVQQPRSIENALTSQHPGMSRFISTGCHHAMFDLHRTSGVNYEATIQPGFSIITAFYFRT